MEKENQRRLAAIVAADVAGFARLMCADEAGTFNRLKALRRDLVQPSIDKHGGRIVKLMGDGLLAEFGSAVQAVNCSVDIQQSMFDHEPGVDEDLRVRLRIGVNLGDVIIAGTDIYGEGVNVAARLEGLAEPGGICISDKVHEEVRGRLETGFEDMGVQAVKNIDRPVRTWRWIQNGKATSAEPLESPRNVDKPAIAVLPFDNMSGDPEQAYFADGISEDITTELSRFGSLVVVSRHSAFKYRGDGLDLEQVGRELGARFLLEGSVRRGGDRVRITVQLIDADTGKHVWAERYDRSLDDIFAIQDEITETVASTVAGRMQAIEIDRARHKRPENLAAYDYLLKGLDLHKGGVMDKATTERAIAMFDKAIELDDGFARAYAWRACSGSRLYGDIFSDEQLDEALQFVKTALSLDEGESETHRIMGSIYLWKRDFERAEKHVKRAIALNPNDANTVVKAATYFSYMGQPEEALASARRAMRLNPHHPDWYWTELGFAFFNAGDFSSAIDSLLNNSEPTFLDLALLAASYAEIDNQADARKYARQLVKTKPIATIDFFRARLPFRREVDIDRLLTGLRKAGVPEE